LALACAGRAGGRQLDRPPPTVGSSHPCRGSCNRVWCISLHL